MAIYDISEQIDKYSEEESLDLPYHIAEMRLGNKDQPPESHLFSSIAARLFFFMLLIADSAWAFLSLTLWCISLCGNIVTGFKIPKLKKYHARRWLNTKRSCVCGVALLVALFSPALGTMFACTYFLMYDKQGIEEVVPSVLQDQFREFLNL